jgi:hypothetical protein
LIAELPTAELGRMRHIALDLLRLPMTRPTQDLLSRSVHARNRLSHLDTVTADALRGLRKAAEAAGY